MSGPLAASDDAHRPAGDGNADRGPEAGTTSTAAEAENSGPGAEATGSHRILILALPG